MKSENVRKMEKNVKNNTEKTMKMWIIFVKCV